MGFKINFDANSLTNKAKEIARQKVADMDFTVNCPHCNKTVTIPKGKNICPFCGKTIDLTLDINF